MSRTINASTLSALQGNSVRMAHLVKMGFDAELNITDYNHDIDYDGDTYSAASHFLGLDATQETQDLRVGTMSISLSGVDQSYISIFLNTEYINRQVQVWLAILDSSNAIVGDPIKTFDGQISGYTLTEGRKTCQINMNVSSHWADFERKAGRLTNNTSQQQYFPNDRGFRWAAKIKRDIKWGRT